MKISVHRTLSISHSYLHDLLFLNLFIHEYFRTTLSLDVKQSVSKTMLLRGANRQLQHRLKYYYFNQEACLVTFAFPYSYVGHSDISGLVWYIKALRNVKII